MEMTELLEQICAALNRYMIDSYQSDLECTELEADLRAQHRLQSLFPPLPIAEQPPTPPGPLQRAKRVNKKRDRRHKNIGKPFDRSRFPPEMIKQYFFAADGRVYRRIAAFGGKAGQECGTEYSSRRPASINLDGFRFPRSHVVFLLHRGRWPVRKIFHRNLDRNDDRIENIIEATHSEICRSARVSSRSRAGVKGVSTEGSGSSTRYRTSICHDGIVQKLGSYKTASECHKVYAKAAAELHGAFNPASRLYNKDGDPK